MRVEVIRRRDAFEREPATFMAKWQPEEERLRAQIKAARAALGETEVPDEMLEQAAGLCMGLGTDGLRGELTLVRAARALAALKGERRVSTSHLRDMAPPALRHRLRRNPLDEAGSGARIERALEEVLGA